MIPDINEQQELRTNPDPFAPPLEMPNGNDRKPEFRSRGRAFLIGCRNGFLWSVAIGAPLSWVMVPAMPRRRSFDEAGNLIPWVDEIGWLGLFQLVAPGLASISAIWTLSAGVAELITHIRQQRSIVKEAPPVQAERY
ncbi:hypothetical protein [Rhodopirellula sp. P2]|uniref:hypothetical protein n=1 Tax=Rhodopirellula sp. P2 TaxID=2127060 RepID=UPI0023680D9B|nr:hypothetical protein [Rhodopirellula sp. P2]WDQ15481.1 hypothetical protein PSR62_17770 [Rhodopirellula sp. P2]